MVTSALLPLPQGTMTSLMASASSCQRLSSPSPQIPLAPQDNTLTPLFLGGEGGGRGVSALLTPL